MSASRTFLLYFASLVPFIAIILVAAFTLYVPYLEAPSPLVPQQIIDDETVALLDSTFATSTIWFVDDMMLSRQVGEFAKEKGFAYSFQNIQGAFAKAYVAANFEGCLATTTRFSWQQPLRFPVTIDFVPMLNEVGITHLSLANNHALDCGRENYDLTHSLLSQAGIAPFGHPILVHNNSVVYSDIGNYRVAIIAIHTLFEEPSHTEIAALIASTTVASDIQIVYVHWGDEYEPGANLAQQALAALLAKHGVDLVVGHHPHVVQNIALVEETVVLYSLGNFIFDQYFSTEVQEGLTISLTLDNHPRLTLHPITSIGSRTQPRFMNDQEKEQFLADLAARSDLSLQTAIASGTISLQL